MSRLKTTKEERANLVHQLSRQEKSGKIRITGKNNAGETVYKLNNELKSNDYVLKYLVEYTDLIIN